MSCDRRAVLLAKQSLNLLLNCIVWVLFISFFSIKSVSFFSRKHLPRSPPFILPASPFPQATLGAPFFKLCALLAVLVAPVVLREPPANERPGNERPGNDVCSDAEEIRCGEELSGTTIDETFGSVGDESIWGTENTAPGVWYKLSGTGGDFVVTETAKQTTSSSNLNTKLFVYKGTS